MPEKTCRVCGDPIDGYDSGGRDLCHDCDQQRRYDVASGDAEETG